MSHFWQKFCHRCICSWGRSHHRCHRRCHRYHHLCHHHRNRHRLENTNRTLRGGPLARIAAFSLSMNMFCSWKQTLDNLHLMLYLFSQIGSERCVNSPHRLTDPSKKWNEKCQGWQIDKKAIMCCETLIFFRERKKVKVEKNLDLFHGHCQLWLEVVFSLLALSNPRLERLQAQLLWYDHWNWISTNYDMIIW